SLAVERTWRSLGGDAPLQPEHRSNAYRFLDLLHKLEGGPDPLSLPLITHRLRKLYADPTTVDTPVELMTIHKAKGLEWDLVLIPSLERGSGVNMHGLLKWLELDSPTDEASFLLSPIQGKGEHASKLSRWLTAAESQRTASEAKRLLYVACTRAREELHLFATVELRPDGAIAAPKRGDSLLKAAWPACKDVLEQQVAPRRSSGEVVRFPEPADASRPEPLALAAAADVREIPGQEPRPAPPIRRLPSSFDPLARFHPEYGAGLAYTPAAALPQSAVFTRPDGSFGARAFGNVVHRFLHLLSVRLAGGQSLDQLKTELPTWQSRLGASLRNEGLAPATAATEARRALHALTATLEDAHGTWLLLPHAQAHSEVPLPAASPLISLRADRTFFAGPLPLLDSPPTHRWIVDYKTAELGGRSVEAFLSGQKAKYLPQMQAYADAAVFAGTDPAVLVLALYFPLLPALLYWPAKEGVVL
ncbi:MAG TPA: 3'-5' exonuclease, partial [Acidobacteriaceae bacterium]|nr:3'-5' exonuclease [Acidobacteriaceae bacterium]